MEQTFAGFLDTQTGNHGHGNKAYDIASGGSDQFCDTAGET